jgi:inorganic pyrophosphatase
MRIRILFVFLILFFLFNCIQKEEIYKLPTFSDNNNINAIIEIPAGTNKKYEYNRGSKEFEIDIIDGKERVIKFLPYPANYGFITSTYSNPTEGGDGDALDIIVISEVLNTGTLLETVPIGVLKLIDNNEYDYKIIAVPVKEKLKIINANTFIELKQNYPIILDILEMWFLNYDSQDSLSTEGWGDEKEAMKEVLKSMK